MRLKDKIAIVTGANAEFGSIISKAFAVEGADVVCADWKQEDADVAAERVRSAGREALALGVDLREKDEVEVMVRRTVETYGRTRHPGQRYRPPASPGVPELQGRGLRRHAGSRSQALLPHRPGRG